jgi:hypothetical protein
MQQDTKQNQIFSSKVSHLNLDCSNETRSKDARDSHFNESRTQLSTTPVFFELVDCIAMRLLEIVNAVLSIFGYIPTGWTTINTNTATDH